MSKPTLGQESPPWEEECRAEARPENSAAEMQTGTQEENRDCAGEAKRNGVGLTWAEKEGLMEIKRQLGWWVEVERVVGGGALKRSPLPKACYS